MKQFIIIQIIILNLEKNVKIKYLNNIIFSDKLDLIFENNIVTIYENVKYNGSKVI